MVAIEKGSVTMMKQASMNNGEGVRGGVNRAAGLARTASLKH